MSDSVHDLLEEAMNDRDVARAELRTQTTTIVMLANTVDLAGADGPPPTTFTGAVQLILADMERYHKLLDNVQDMLIERTAEVDQLRAALRNVLAAQLSPATTIEQALAFHRSPALCATLELLKDAA